MFSEQATIGCECEALFDVVADVARYPEFVPGWREVRVLRDDQQGMLVDQHLAFGGIGTWVRSLALLYRPERIEVRPLDTNVGGLHLKWHFAPAPAGGCDVSLRVDGRASSRWLAPALETLVDQVGRRLVSVFAARAVALQDATGDHGNHRDAH